MCRQFTRIQFSYKINIKINANFFISRFLHSLILHEPLIEEMMVTTINCLWDVNYSLLFRIIWGYTKILSYFVKKTGLQQYFSISLIYSLWLLHVHVQHVLLHEELNCRSLRNLHAYVFIQRLRVIKVIKKCWYFLVI